MDWLVSLGSHGMYLIKQTLIDTETARDQEPAQSEGQQSLATRDVALKSGRISNHARVFQMVVLGCRDILQKWEWHKKGRKRASVNSGITM